MELSIESRQTSLQLDAQENISEQNEELVKKMKELKKLETKIASLVNFEPELQELAINTNKDYEKIKVVEKNVVRGFA